MRRVKVNVYPIDTYEVWLADIPDDADEKWVEENMDKVSESFVELVDSGNYGYELAEMEEA